MSSILVVDDEPLVRVSIASMIDAAQHGIDHVHTAANGAEALTILDEAPDIDLVLLDLVMPTMDGIEFLKRFNDREHRPRIVVLSSHDDYGGVREAFRLGVEDYLLKSDLEPSMIARLVAEAAGQADYAHENPHIQRNNLRALQRGLLRELILGEEIPGFHDRLSELSIELSPPFVLLGLWVRDFGLVRMRYDATGLARFQAMLPEYVAESVERVHLGYVCPIDVGHVVAVFHSAAHSVTEPGRVHGLSRQIAETLRHYLNIDLYQNQSAPIRHVDELASAYQRIASSRPMTTRTVSRAMGYIQQHYTDPDLTLETVSGIVGVSRTHLSTQFHKDTGTSFTEYLTLVRVEAAKQLLACTDLKVYEVADKIGYATPEHFSRVFKKVTGVSPGSFAAPSAF